MANSYSRTPSCCTGKLSSERNKPMTARHEYKIPCDTNQLSDIEVWVRLHPAHWRVSYLPRQINNVYFDSPDLADLNANLSGVGLRQKLRMRWYGPDKSCSTTAQLELKCKQGLAGWKETEPVTQSLELSHGTWPDLVNRLRDSVTERAQLWLAHHQVPVLINSYKRSYFETPDGMIRLTIDTQLRAYDQRLSLAPNLDREVLQPNSVIVELKAPVDNKSTHRLMRLLESGPARTDRFSKYLHGMLASTYSSQSG